MRGISKVAVSLASVLAVSGGWMTVPGAASAGVPVEASTVKAAPAVKNKVGKGRAVLHIDADQVSVKKLGAGMYRAVFPSDAVGQWMGERVDASGRERLLVGDLTASQLAKRWSDFRYSGDGVGASLIWDSGARPIRLFRPVLTDKGVRVEFRSSRGVPSVLRGVTLSVERAPEGSGRADVRSGTSMTTYTIATSDSSTNPATSLMFDWTFTPQTGAWPNTVPASVKARIYNLNNNNTCWSYSSNYDAQNKLANVKANRCANISYESYFGSPSNPSYSPYGSPYGLLLFNNSYGCVAYLQVTPPNENPYKWSQVLAECSNYKWVE